MDSWIIGFLDPCIIQKSMNPLNSILKWIHGFFGLLDYLGVWAGLGVELGLDKFMDYWIHVLDYLDYNPIIHEFTCSTYT